MTSRRFIICLFFIPLVVANECERLTSKLHFISTERTKTNDGDSIYQIICVGECETDWNRNLPPIEIDCEKISEKDWTCFDKRKDLIGGYSISCEPCGNSQNLIVAGSCALELESWVLRVP
jgi:hypothetical protein